MVLRYPGYRRQATKYLISCGVLLLLRFFWLPGFSARRYNTWDWTDCPGSLSFEPSCTAPSATIAQDIQIVIRTGGSEPQSRLRSQLSTILSQIPQRNVLIFSDMQEEIGSYHVQDVYADLSEQERASYPEFALYDTQLEYKKQEKDTRELQGGWDLGK
jgi:hypothetical protein